MPRTTEASQGQRFIDSALIIALALLATVVLMPCVLEDCVALLHNLV